jgi:hypothetical protein
MKISRSIAIFAVALVCTQSAITIWAQSSNATLSGTVSDAAKALAGVSAANVVVQRDGVDASAAGRWPAGFQAATIVNPDLVGEMEAAATRCSAGRAAALTTGCGPANAATIPS